MSSYDSDAPDDVSFSTTKEHALREFEKTKHERERQDNTKEWRKRRDALYKEQKEKKVLSMSVLTKAENELSERSMSARKRKRYVEEENEEDDSDGGFSDVESNDDEASDTAEGNLVPDENELRPKSDEEIPRISIKVLDKIEQKSMLQTALDFKFNALYGKGVHRMTMAAYRQQQEKKKVTARNRKCHNKAERILKKWRRNRKSKRSKVPKCMI